MFQQSLRVVLAGHDETSTIIENYPEYITPKSKQVNKAFGFFLLAMLEGNAKTIAFSHVNDGFAMLQDLIRHCHKLTPMAKTNILHKLMSIKQSRNESMTYYLTRW